MILEKCIYYVEQKYFEHLSIWDKFVQEYKPLYELCATFLRLKSPFSLFLSALLSQTVCNKW